MKYILTKNNIKRLIQGKHVVDERGRRFVAGDKVIDVLKTLDEHNAYDKFDAVIENGQLDLVRKKE